MEIPDFLYKATDTSSIPLVSQKPSFLILSMSKKCSFHPPLVYYHHHNLEVMMLCWGKSLSKKPVRSPVMEYYPLTGCILLQLAWGSLLPDILGRV
jgi:hypothetical protein